MIDKFEMDFIDLDDIQTLIFENERLNSGPGGIMEMKQTIADKEKEIEAWKGIHEGAVLAMQAEITRLKEKCDKQAMILRRLTPENYPNTLFISGILGALDQNNMPKKICVVPAYGVDFSYVYEYNGTNIVQEW
jgi:hypothetical protein